MNNHFQANYRGRPRLFFMSNDGWIKLYPRNPHAKTAKDAKVEIPLRPSRPLREAMPETT